MTIWARRRGSLSLEVFQPQLWRLCLDPTQFITSSLGNDQRHFWKSNVKEESFPSRVTSFIYPPSSSLRLSNSMAIPFYFLKVFLFISSTSNSCLIIISLISIKETWQLQNIWGKGGRRVGMRGSGETEREKEICAWLGVLREPLCVTLSGRPASQPCGSSGHYFLTTSRVFVENGMKSLQLRQQGGQLMSPISTTHLLHLQRCLKWCQAPMSPPVFTATHTVRSCYRQ